ncbi:hypothetical protein SD71_19125 [Cohnella kolymensis]|uniref:DUF1934 domain-containing protein n=1 Tax=Cohnella kolymensis TaxID=1590652 RepID=A0ABR5A0H4_9BACL|nr:DUF1934 domain-containing protein [Cohnella kolymensis]KIL34569.1 hypothetical protein SD71_19125 [Cohnella kolymensis]
MPDKRSVAVDFQSRQQDGSIERSVMHGELHRLVTGWVLTCAEPADDSGAGAAMTLIVHERELRLRRRGAFSFEQVFLLNTSVQGFLETPYGPHDVNALTHGMDIHLSESGGVIEWKYDLLMQEQTVGTFEIRLDIREEQAV